MKALLFLCAMMTIIAASEIEALTGLTESRVKKSGVVNREMVEKMWDAGQDSRDDGRAKREETDLKNVTWFYINEPNGNVTRVRVAYELPPTGSLLPPDEAGEGNESG